MLIRIILTLAFTAIGLPALAQGSPERPNCLMSFAGIFVLFGLIALALLFGLWRAGRAVYKGMRS